MSENKEPIKKPEVVPLPTEDAAVVSKKLKEPPYFLVLNQQKQQYFQVIS